MWNIFLLKAQPYFNSYQPPPTAFGQAQPQSHYPSAPVHYPHPNFAAYIDPNMSNSIPTQFIPNGHPIGWPTPQSAQYAPPMPFSPNPNYHPNAQPRQVDPRLLPRPQLHQSQRPPSQSIPTQSVKPIARPSRWQLPNRSNGTSTAKKSMTYGDYLKKKQSDQGDVNVAKKAANVSKICDDARKQSTENVAAAIDPKPSTNGNNRNDDNDEDSNEPAFSPAASESNPSSSTSVTPTPPSPPNDNGNGNESEDERIPDDELHDSGDKQGDQCLTSVKTENEACESDKATDYESDDTVEFNYENLKRIEGLDDCGAPISNGNGTASSKFLDNSS